MKSVFFGYDLFGREAAWTDLQSKNSLLIGGLSGSGKSYLTQKISEQFLDEGFRVIVISDKARVDFKSERMEKIDTIEEMDRLSELIDDVLLKMRETKRLIEDSQFSHALHIQASLKILIIVDELSSIAEIDHVDKNLRRKFEQFCSRITRQGRYLGVFIIYATQIASVSETNLPIRQSSIIITGKTDTKQLSESLFGTDVAYSSDFLGQGIFVMWDRMSAPKFVRIQERKRSPYIYFSIYIAWTLKLLRRIWTSFRKHGNSA